MRRSSRPASRRPSSAPGCCRSCSSRCSPSASGAGALAPRSRCPPPPSPSRGDLMSWTVPLAVLLILLPVAFNAAFAALAARFDYPDILRKPTGEVLARFREGGSALVLLWWGFAMTAVLLAPVAVLLAFVLEGADPALLALGAVAGVLAALVQFLGLVRWPFLVPYLARADADPQASAGTRQAVDVVFQSFNRYLGVAVGEHLGYLFTGAWSILAGIAMIQADVPAWV